LEGDSFYSKIHAQTISSHTIEKLNLIDRF